MKLMIVTSYQLYERIPEIRSALEALGHIITLPNMYGVTVNKESHNSMSDNEFVALKGPLIRKNLETIPAQDALLVLNLEKNGVPNYIGGATFLEIYDAWRLGKKIFLYNQLPKNIFYDELRGMAPIVLNGDLRLIK